MGHHHSTQHKFQLNKKSNTKLSNETKTQQESTDNSNKILPKLKLKLSNNNKSSGQSSIYSQSIASLPSLDIQQNSNSITIKNMMENIINSHNIKPNNNTNNNNIDYEKFFIAFHQKQQQKTNDSIYNTAIGHRVAFISLIGLYQSFRRIPTHILFSSIFILKIRREWLYNPSQYTNDNNNTLHTLQYDEDNEFIMLLKWKDSQSLLFCMYDNNNTNTSPHTPNNNEINNELPMDFGIDDIDNDIDDINNENAFDFARDIPILSSPPTTSDIYNATPCDLPIDIDLPITPSDYDSNHIPSFNPPLQLQRNEEHYNDIMPTLTLTIESDTTSDNNINVTTPSNYNSVTHTPHAPAPMSTTTTSSINNKYIQLSNALATIYDPFNSNNYNPLLFDNKWWSNYKSQYGTITNEILNELSNCDMNYRCVMEILYQANPSLIPCKSYRELENVSITAHTHPRKLQLEEINNILSHTGSLYTIDGCEHIDSGSYCNEYNEFSGSHNDVYLDYDSNITSFIK